MGRRAIVCSSCGEDVPVTGESSIDCPNCGRTYHGLDGIGAASPSAGPEKGVEQRCIDLYQSVGCAVWKTSQPQRAVGSTRGLPDLLVFRRDYTGDVPPMWFHEVKPTDDFAEAQRKQREEQRLFEKMAAEAGVEYVLGGVETAARFLGLE